MLGSIVYTHDTMILMILVCLLYIYDETIYVADG